MPANDVVRAIAAGPDNITDHSFANIQSLANTLANGQIAANVNPIGLAANFPGLKNVVTDQASIHTSDAIFEKLEEWRERNKYPCKINYTF